MVGPSKHRKIHTHAQCSHASVGLAQARPNYLATRPEVEGFRDQGLVLQKANLQIPYFLIGSVGKQVKQHMQCVRLVIKWLTTIPT